MQKKKKNKVRYCLKVHLLFRSASTIYILRGHLVLGYVLVTSTPLMTGGYSVSRDILRPSLCPYVQIAYGRSHAALFTYVTA